MRKAISEYNKRLVLLKDTHLSGELVSLKDTNLMGERFYFSGRIFYNEEDKQCYKFQRVDGETKGEILQLHFHDLEGLLVSLIRVK